MKVTRKLLSVVLLSVVMILAVASISFASEGGQSARPSTSGQLRVEGTQLVDSSGSTIQLRGVSTHGLNWFPKYINQNLFDQISKDWDCDLVRLAMYSTSHVGGERETNLQLVRQGIDAAIKADMYVIVDWHVLEDENPTVNQTEALEFFDLIASEYPDNPNIIYEICNEPNGSALWSDIVDYANEVIPLIRSHSPNALIIVGTPDYDKNLGEPILRPLQYENIMYSLHFYASTHKEGLREELKSAHEAGLPVFISECGLCESDGDGRIDEQSVLDWFTYLYDNQISYAIWNLSDKDEASSFFRPGFDPYGEIQDRNLTATGKWVREVIKGVAPSDIDVVLNAKYEWVNRIISWTTNSLGERGYRAVVEWPKFALIVALIFLINAVPEMIYRKKTGQDRKSYWDVIKSHGKEIHYRKGHRFARVSVFISAYLTIIYLGWRLVFSIPWEYGVIPVVANILLLLVEGLGFVESLILFQNILGIKSIDLPKIPDDAWPDVDIFIATYNEPTDLLYRTVNGCKHIKYPDLKKVHIWICDDNRRPEMKKLAEDMGVGYFDRPDNKGAKAGNLNAALARTSAPYVVTLDADMIPKSDFLLKTIPYFVDVELSEADRPEADRLHLGLLQTPQCFYDPDVFQFALHAEDRVPNEQDFFYRTIEPAKSSSNSVIYGGSNTILSRRALEDIGGFYTESITEDFATGLLIESKGYVSLALPEPLASGQTPHTYKEHIQQRTRWGRGVIVTAKKLKIFGRKELTFRQKISYWSSVIYWYSPIKNLIYMLSPLLYAVLAVPVFKCNWLELIVFWVPMFIMQDACMVFNSKRVISTKWSGIYETSVMPHLLIPILQEAVGISLSKFKVTDKSGRAQKRQRDLHAMMPFIILIALSVIGIVRIIYIFKLSQAFSFLVLLFWIVRNLYFLIMALFLIDGRDADLEPIKVKDADFVSVKSSKGTFDGVTTLLTEHNFKAYLDESEDLAIGDNVEIVLTGATTVVEVSGIVTNVRVSRSGKARAHSIEILDYRGNRDEYLQLIYDRVPSLPQSLSRDIGGIIQLWHNITARLLRTVS